LLLNPSEVAAPPAPPKEPAAFALSVPAMSMESASIETDPKSEPFRGSTETFTPAAILKVATPV
jgi:hypothetical protein